MDVDVGVDSPERLICATWEACLKAVLGRRSTPVGVGGRGALGRSDGGGCCKDLLMTTLRCGEDLITGEVDGDLGNALPLLSVRGVVGSGIPVAEICRVCRLSLNDTSRLC